MSSQLPGAQLLIQLHTNAPGEAKEDGPDACTPATHLEGLEKAPGS